MKKRGQALMSGKAQPSTDTAAKVLGLGVAGRSHDGIQGVDRNNTRGKVTTRPKRNPKDDFFADPPDVSAPSLTAPSTATTAASAISGRGNRRGATQDSVFGGRDGGSSGAGNNAPMSSTHNILGTPVKVVMGGGPHIQPIAVTAVNRDGGSGSRRRKKAWEEFSFQS